MQEPTSVLIDILRSEDYLRSGCVYYAGIGEHIKIGYTKQLRTRMWALRPDVLLAAEPGERLLELRRHDQFKHRRIPGDGELFEPADDLLHHIEDLAQTYLMPPLGERKHDGRGNRKPRMKKHFYNH